MENRQDQSLPGLADEVREILRCPRCHERVTEDEGGLRCTACPHKFPLVNGVLRFVDEQYYAGSFGFQWLKHDRTQLDTENSRRSELDFVRKTRLRPEDLAG